MGTLNKSFIEVTPNGGSNSASVSVKANANTTTSARSTSIKATSGTLERTITINQEGNVLQYVAVTSVRNLTLLDQLFEPIDPPVGYQSGDFVYVSIGSLHKPNKMVTFNTTIKEIMPKTMSSVINVSDVSFNQTGVVFVVDYTQLEQNMPVGVVLSEVLVVFDENFHIILRIVT